MNNDFPRQERIFKIFTPVRCLSRDQLPRYLNGNMTDWEKHLIEQHLVDCDLCHDALESLQNPKNKEPYERLSKQLSLYLQREYAPAVQQSSLKTRHTPQGNNTRESLLSYFWVIMFLALGGGSIFLLREHLKNRPALVVKTTDAVIIPASTESQYLASETKPPVIQSQYSIAKDSSANKTQPKDSALLAAKKKPVAKDTLKKVLVTDTNTRIQPAVPVVKEAPKEEKVVATPPPPPAPKEKEKEKEDDPKPVAATQTGDESLFRAAMLYQQQGNVNEAIDQFRRLSTNYKFSERAKYQLALCYRTKGQNGKARRLLREIVRMEGPLKAQAQSELNNLN
ncbi:tetratricopeptide repeat protein [Chitinophaga sp. SYP-B3965]|uniref:tetratricopeptide repeat protein n=1 Tax=Chitinophaga sp. SYP-B3965 TaxID=2663120 RepID=UPI0012996701|nr:tetratricopeptide repeat protein [Chitinophaga sp. SYP-B3965]MRG43946.1 tetratricopeptide repeat protein [Chitinophaga sp. SYP-B3965]